MPFLPRRRLERFIPTSTSLPSSWMFKSVGVSALGGQRAPLHGRTAQPEGLRLFLRPESQALELHYLFCLFGDGLFGLLLVVSGEFLDVVPGLLGVVFCQEGLVFFLVYVFVGVPADVPYGDLDLFAQF